MARKFSLLAGIVVASMLGRLGAANRLFVEGKTAKVGDTGVTVPIKLDCDLALYGFSLSIAVDTALVAITGMDLAGTLSAGAEFSDGQVLESGSRISYGVVLEVNDPFDAGNVIPVGTGHLVANLVLDMTATEAASATIAFQDFAGTAQTALAKNVLVSTTGGSVPPTTENGTLTIEKPDITDPVFTRGNANGDDKVDISDPVWHLGFLFLGGPEPPCMSASDSDDSGVLDITDAIYTLNFLFTGGPAPPAPFPDRGADPTLDTLGCKTSEAP